jgi:DNA repair protein RadC
MKFSNLPEEERPKARLEFSGIESISNAELISLAIGTDDIAKGYGILAGLDRGIASLPDMSVAELEGIGFSKTQAVRFTAANELFSRARSAGMENLKIDSPSQVAEFFDDRLRNETIERCFVMCLNIKGVLSSYFELSAGSSNSSVVDGGELYRQAIKRAATAVILVHNHPSGDSSPSPEDVGITQKLIKAGETLYIRFLDHIVIGRGEFTSIKELHGHIFGNWRDMPLELRESAQTVNEVSEFEDELEFEP